ncbi:MAG: hydrogenase maturation nickel metallochaperone HypA [Lachnospiraceae bacterium]|nr:hydrogenase maturation nickel metallochaperone HypA [Lachnospiraceae bacterium]
MHELPVVEDLIKQLDEESAERDIRRISSVELVIGELSSVVDEAVQMYFDLLSEGHSCEGARLKFRFVPSRLKCTSCGEEFEHEKAFACPRCGAPAKLIKGSGREFYIKSFHTEEEAHEQGKGD